MLLWHPCSRARRRRTSKESMSEGGERGALSGPHPRGHGSGNDITIHSTNNTSNNSVFVVLIIIVSLMIIIVIAIAVVVEAMIVALSGPHARRHGGPRGRLRRGRLRLGLLVVSLNIYIYIYI